MQKMNDYTTTFVAVKQYIDTKNEIKSIRKKHR